MVHGVWLLLEVATDLRIHIVLVYRHVKCKSHRVMGASTQISKEGLEARQCTPERLMHKVVRVMPYVQ